MERPGAIAVHLLPTFRAVQQGEDQAAVEELSFPASVQRLVALLAVHAHHPLSRAFVAGTLWPETTDDKASANLRSALWRVRQIAGELVIASASCVQLGSAVCVDVLDAREDARGPTLPPDRRAWTLLDALGSDLLQDWYDPWVSDHRERWRLTRLGALERLASVATSAARYDIAVDAALGAIHAEPLRETAHAALIEAHLAAGNVAEAVRTFDRYADRLADALRVRPSAGLRARLQEVLESAAITQR